jgi:hypothetical protein
VVPAGGSGPDSGEETPRVVTLNAVKGTISGMVPFTALMVTNRPATYRCDSAPPLTLNSARRFIAHAGSVEPESSGCSSP